MRAVECSTPGSRMIFFPSVLNLSSFSHVLSLSTKKILQWKGYLSDIGHFASLAYWKVLQHSYVSGSDTLKIISLSAPLSHAALPCFIFL